ncbi:MAG: hypothetical protein JSW00_07980 [Thermoplasmata archaeon]|nr:MAG: hypothetical protein JSW00_07980 [Thermoplasmata archaeon]
MQEKEDLLFYAGYGLSIVMLGLMSLLYSIGFIDGWAAFGMWLLATSLILVGLGMVRTESAPHGSRALMGFGFLLTIISIAILGIILKMVTPTTAFALLILLAGLGILALGLSRARSAS